MADIRKKVECDYCGAKYQLKYPEDMPDPDFCCACSELLSASGKDDDEEDDDGDLDYTEDQIEN